MSKKRIIAGIDIGSSKTSTVIGSIDENENISIVGVAKSDSRGIRKGQIVDIEEATESVVTSLEAAERMAGYQVHSAFVSVGGIHISSQNSHGVVAVADPTREITEQDVMRVIDAAKAISLPSSRQIIHVIPRFFTVDSQEGIKDPAGMSGVRLEVDTHLVSGGLTSLKNLEKCMATVGVETDAFVFSGLASSESVLTDTEKELGVVLLDIGAGTTDIAIYVEGALSYSAVLPVGARNVTNDLAIGLRISLESAEKLKMFLGRPAKHIVTPDNSFEQDKYKKSKTREEDEVDITTLNLPEGIQSVSKKTVIEGIIRPRLNELFSLVVMEIKKSGFMTAVPSGLVITGGGSMTVGISESARRSVALPFRTGRSQEIKGVTDEVTSPSFATAVGLLKYGMRMKKNDENFLPVRLPQLFKGVPIKGTASKIVDIVKSFLP